MYCIVYVLLFVYCIAHRMPYAVINIFVKAISVLLLDRCDISCSFLTFSFTFSVVFVILLTENYVANTVFFLGSYVSN